MREYVAFTDYLVKSTGIYPLQMIRDWLDKELRSGNRYEVQARRLRDDGAIYEFLATMPGYQLTKTELIAYYEDGWEVMIFGEWRSKNIDRPRYEWDINWLTREPEKPRSAFY